MTAPSDIANAVASAQKSTMSVGSWPTWLTFFALVAGLLTAYVKTGPARTKADSDADASLRADEAALRERLTVRVETLESKIDQNEKECAERIDKSLKENDARWEMRLKQVEMNYKEQIAGLSRQIAALQVDTGKVLRLAAGTTMEASTSMERVVSDVIRETTDRLDP